MSWNGFFYARVAVNITISGLAWTCDTVVGGLSCYCQQHFSVAPRLKIKAAAAAIIQFLRAWDKLLFNPSPRSYQLQMHYFNLACLCNTAGVHKSIKTNGKNLIKNLNIWMAAGHRSAIVKKTAKQKSDLWIVKYAIEGLSIHRQRIMITASMFYFSTQPLFKTTNSEQRPAKKYLFVVLYYLKETKKWTHLWFLSRNMCQYMGERFFFQAKKNYFWHPNHLFTVVSGKKLKNFYGYQKRLHFTNLKEHMYVKVCVRAIAKTRQRQVAPASRIDRRKPSPDAIGRCGGLHTCLKSTDAQRRLICDMRGWWSSTIHLRASMHVSQVDRHAASVKFGQFYIVEKDNFAFHAIILVTNWPTRSVGRFAILEDSILRNYSTLFN